MIGALKTDAHVEYLEYFKNIELSMFSSVFSLTKFTI